MESRYFENLLNNNENKKAQYTTANKPKRQTFTRGSRMCLFANRYGKANPNAQIQSLAVIKKR